MHLDSANTLREIAILDKFFIDEAVGFKGRFLEIGADDGKDHLYHLLAKGWDGVYCEPDPRCCYELIKNTESYKNQVTIINSAVMDQQGLIDFYFSSNGSGTSSLDQSWHERMKEHVPESNIRKIITNAISTQELLTLVGTDFDIVSIDAEGSDDRIVTSIDWQQFDRCRILLIEGNLHLRNQLEEQGNFKVYTETDSNIIYVKDQYLKNQ